jgi:valyl-tRNA synthetase
MSEQPSSPELTKELPKAYDPSVIEEHWAEYWVRERLFDVPTPKNTLDETEKFTILLPPPNITGRLHMGHMLNQTEMDILTRWHRMLGDLATWIPGTDHAGIATQMMVERQLKEQGTSRKELGREAFVQRVWCWRKLYGGAILEQMKRLGASVDWEREYFTMDDRLSVAVKEAFIRLYEQGLIYRGAYIVNWDPSIQTAVSDLEVEHEERIGKLYHIRYPLADGSAHITVATTRPETMLGDTAVAVNPTDARYTAVIGKKVRVPMTGVNGGPDREVPILADDWAKPEFGTGAVKVTPAHDPNDFAIGQRHNLPSLSILDETARVALPGSPYDGLDRYDARDRIVADLEAHGLLESIKDHTLTIGLSQRTGVVIEPRLSLQWFLAVNKTPNTGGKSIAQNAINAVESINGEKPAIHFTPEMYKKIYLEWMTNIHDWCISRQLWWGHRIPAWHCKPCGGITVSRETPTHCGNCNSTDIVQETDVLDTWFSSGLLPFTTLGWPNADADGKPQITDDLANFYPTTLLVTGFDILFFWVARMIMLGCHFTLDVPMPDGSKRTLADAVPFKEVYIHGLVRDANREKMSKTKGNVINPIDIIERFGTDAVRFTLASMASPGTDIAFSEARTEGYRAFANKIWNAARFLFMNIDRAKEAGITIDLTTLSAAPGAPSFAQFAKGGLKDGSSSEGSPSSSTDPIALEHSVTGKVAEIIAASTPEGKAALVIGDEEGNFDQAPPKTLETLEARWILTRLSETCASVDNSLAAYRFDEAANTIYQFFWGALCDWHLEIVKLRLNFGENDDKQATTEALSNLVAVFEASLRLLSPFMPFLTEEIWHALYNQQPPAKSIALTRYPQAADFPADPIAASAMQTLQDLITTIRALRKELGVPEKESTPIHLHASNRIIALADANQDMLSRMARVASIEFASDPLSGSNARSTADFDVAVIYERHIDIPAERERLTKELARLEKILISTERQLNNPAFIAKAPAHIVDGLRKQYTQTKTLYDKTKGDLDALS